MSVLKVKDPTTGEWKEIQSIQGPPGQVDGLLTLGIDQTDGLAYVYYNGVRQGNGIAVGGGSPPVRKMPTIRATRFGIQKRIPRSMKA